MESRVYRPLSISPPAEEFVRLISRSTINGIIGVMRTSTVLRPLTNEQAVQLRDDLALVEGRLQDIAILMRVCFGEEGQVFARAEETSAASQRLKWELERTKLRKQAAGSA